MARRNVVTARGNVLNFEELVMKAQKPLQSSNVDLKDKVTPQKMPTRQINMAGFVPDSSGVAKPTLVSSPKNDSPAERPQPSMADLTAVTVESSTRFKEKPDDPAAAANETLQEIISDLDQFKGRDNTENSKRIKKS